MIFGSIYKVKDRQITSEVICKLMTEFTNRGGQIQRVKVETATEPLRKKIQEAISGKDQKCRMYAMWDR